MTPQPPSRLRLRVVARSDVGLIRKNNQDSGYASPQLLVVADGMGGAAAGDLASAVAIDTIKDLDTPELLAGPTPDEDDRAEGDQTANDQAEETVIVGRPAEESSPPEQGASGLNPALGRFAAAINDANDRIADLVADDYSLEGMGTTVTGAVFDGARLGLAHIGDSRAYLLRGGRLEQLTHDHSWVQSLVDEGKILPAEAAYHPHRSLLLKVLNGQPANDPDLTTVELQTGDRVLFCSDGLSGMVDDPDIAHLAGNPDLDEAVDTLVHAALAAGGVDNVTVILAEAEEDDRAIVGSDDDTAVRRTIAPALVLGAATERQIPAVSRRSSVVPGFEDDEDEDTPTATAELDSPSPVAPPRTADDESRYAPGPPTKRRLIRTLFVGLVVVLIAAAGLGAGYAWTRTQYFVGASDGQVAIFQGLPDGIPGLALSQVFEVQELPVASLPAYYQAQVTAGIEVASLDAARGTVEQLREAAARCRPTPPTATPAPTTSSTADPSPGSSASPDRSTPPPSPAASSPTPAPTPGQGC